PPRVEVRELTARATAPHSAYEVVFAAALLWGLMGCAAAFAVSFVTERASGTLVRLSAAPVGRGAIVGGKALACGIACTADALLLWGFSRVALGVQVPSPLLFLAALLSTVACFVGITMTLAGLGKTEQAVAGAGWSTLIVMAMLGGAMVPRYLLPAWLQSVGLVSPVHWGIRALEAASFRGLGAAELVVPCAVLLGTGLAGFAGGLVLLRRAG
ncbi:MAG: ABC transporter permease, partial [Deltaproteobacteria bacterium]|nr:ABC transporter permease [Deltaproteobacteria bacterium]